MKTKKVLPGLAMAVVLQLGVLAGSAQTNIYLFSGSETNITLPPGTYIITAYGAPGGPAGYGGLGAEMSAEFNFSTSTNLTLLVGGGASSLDTNGNYYEYGGGGGSFVVNGSTPMVIAGGGGGGYEYGSPGSVSTNGNRGNLPGPGAGGAGGGGGAELSYTYSSGGGGGGGGFLGNGGDGGNGFSFGYSITNGGGGGFSFENGGGGGIASSYYGIANYYHGGNGGYGGGGSGGGYSGVPDMGYFPEPGGGGGGGGYEGGHGGNAPDGGNGGGSIIDPSAIAILTEVSGIASPDDSANGEIIIIAVPTPLLITTHAAFGFINGVFGFNVIGPAGSNVVIEASTDLQTWIPLQANLLGSGPLYFSDPQWTNYPERFYRAASAFTVGGTLTGLPAGDTVTLQDNGGDDLTLTTNGTFTFPTALPNGQSYSVTVSGTGGETSIQTEIDWPPVTANGSGTISGANVTNVVVQCMPLITGDRDLDMYNAAVADGTAHGGVPGVMPTENGGPFRVTALGNNSVDVAYYYSSWAVFTTVVGSTSCSATSFPSGTQVIQFGSSLECGSGGPFGY